MAEKDRFIKLENKRICFCISPEDKSALEMIDAKENRTVSAVVRSAVETLDREMLLELISCINVGEGKQLGQRKYRDIVINYNFVDTAG